jgi:uncharacterized metal-binding protein YceD (DUF177 family)
MTDRFAHALRLDQIRDGERIDLAADEAERAAVAKRLRLGRIDRFDAHAALSRDGPRIRAQGRLVAAVEQSCVITGEPVPARLDEPFDILFMPEPDVVRPDEEIELSPEDCDVVFHDGATIDLGGAIADTLALALDPYPRSAGADEALREAGVISEAEASPFAVLARLKGKDES